MIDQTGAPEFNSVWDIVNYLWLLGAYWIKDFMVRIKALEDKSAVSPTNEQVEARVDKELGRVNQKLDRMEKMMTDYLMSGHRYPIDINLGEK